MLCPRRRIFVVFIVSPILGLLLIYHLFHGQGQGRSDLGSSYYPFPFTFSSTTSTKTEVDTTDGYGYGDTDAAIHCPEIPGLDNILVILKTGVTEAFDKIPVHVRTTLKCVPHYAIFSDYEEDIIITDEKEMKVSKVRSIDVLRNVSQEIKETSPDFDLYNRVQRAGRAGLQHADVNRDKDDGNSPFGKQDNPGWRLDKWKFLPMVDEALQIRPEAEWFVFIEADTYVVWSNLERWLARLDSSQPLYLGSPMQIGDVLFAYGGAGIVLSNPAMRQVSEYRAQQIEELDRYTDMHWAGDCVLGNALADVGIPLSWAWPMMQTSQVWELDHISQGYGRRPWCHPAVSYHHMTAEDIKSMWRFDQEWFGQHAQVRVYLYLRRSVNEIHELTGISKEKQHLLIRLSYAPPQKRLPSLNPQFYILLLILTRVHRIHPKRKLGQPLPPIITTHPHPKLRSLRPEMHRGHPMSPILVRRRELLHRQRRVEGRWAPRDRVRVDGRED